MKSSVRDNRPRAGLGVVLAAALALMPAVALDAPMASAAQVDLAWDANTEADLAGYRVHWGETSGGYNQSADAGPATAYTVTGLVEGRTYHFAVTAYDLAGNASGYSNEVSYAVPGVPDIGVRSGGVEIIAGDASPSAADGTDFGLAQLGGRVLRAFTIVNAGTARLCLTGAAPVTVSGASAADYSVVLQPQAAVEPGGSVVFEVAFTTAAEGLRQAEISVASDDPDENPYRFAVQGTGCPPPETLTAPEAPIGPSAVDARSTYTYYVGGSTGSRGEPVQYCIDWGDGTDTGWLPSGSSSAAKSWTSAATCAVRAKARCVFHPEVESGWSAPLAVTVSKDTTPPGAPRGLKLGHR